MAIIQGVIEFAISYLTYSYSYDVIDEDGKQTGCELLGILIISINIWGNLAVSACIFNYLYSNCTKMEYFSNYYGINFNSIIYIFLY